MASLWLWKLRPNELIFCDKFCSILSTTTMKKKKDDAKSDGQQGKRRSRRSRPVSLYPMKVEEALRCFMQVDPSKVIDKLRRIPPTGSV